MWNAGRVLGFASLVALLLALVPADVAAQKKKKDKDTPSPYPQATDADYANMQKTVIGKIVTIDGGKSVSFRAEFSHLEANPKYKPPTNNQKNNPQYQLWAAYNDLQVQMQRIPRNAKDAAQIQQRINQDIVKIQTQATAQMMQASKVNNDPNNQPFITVTNTKDFDLEIEDKAVFRKMFLPVEYDDEGKIKKYTAEDKLALKGDDKSKPGYKASTDEAQPMQEAKLYMTLPKKKAKAKDNDKEAKDEVPDVPERPTVHMIVLTKEAPPMTSAAPPAKEKKKKN